MHIRFLARPSLPKTIKGERCSFSSRLGSCWRSCAVLEAFGQIHLTAEQRTRQRDVTARAPTWRSVSRLLLFLVGQIYTDATVDCIHPFYVMTSRSFIYFLNHFWSRVHWCDPSCSVVDYMRVPLRLYVWQHWRLLTEACQRWLWLREICGCNPPNLCWYVCCTVQIKGVKQLRFFFSPSPSPHHALALFIPVWD